MGGLNLARKRIGGITTLKDAENSIRDLESLIDSLVMALATTEDNPSTGEVKAFVRGEDGKFYLYSLVSGAGVTITTDTAAKTLTFTSP